MTVYVVCIYVVVGRIWKRVGYRCDGESSSVGSIRGYTAKWNKVGGGKSNPIQANRHTAAQVKSERINLNSKATESM